MHGTAAIAIWCDIGAGVKDEFEHWHAHEHMPERLSIPGFLRGTRWQSAGGGEGQFILYEVEGEAATASAPYLQRLNDPTPWTRKMMPHHRNMVRSLCRVRASAGAALGQALLTLRLSPRDAGRLDRWLATELLPVLASRKGLVAAHFLENVARPDIGETVEQKIRGGDAAADWILLVSGYSPEALAGVARELDEAALARRGAAPGSASGLYRLAYLLAR
jgi:hypothetical protein